MVIRQDHFDWQAKGGTAIYSNFSYRDTTLIFPSVPVISYEQSFKSPYVGLGLHSGGIAAATKMSFDASVSYSNWVDGKAIDINHLRALKFKNSGGNGGWYEIELGLTFSINKRLSIGASYAAQSYNEIKVTTEITDLITGEKTFYGRATAGMEHSSELIAVKLDYRF